MTKKTKLTIFIIVAQFLYSCGGGGNGSIQKYSLEPILEELAYPVRVSSFPNGNLVYAELMTGNIYEYNSTTNKKQIITSFPPATAELAGISGLLVDNNFTQNKFIFVYHYNQEKRLNVVTRVTVEPSIKKEEILQLGEASGHNGGGMIQTADGMIYLGVGDGDSPQEAKNIASKYGKIVIFNRNGVLHVQNGILAVGLRNPFGVTALNDQIFIADNGPECDDEVNVFSPNQDYGWSDNYTCGSLEGLAGSIFSWQKSEGLTDLIAIDNAKISEFNQSILVSRFNTNSITLLKLDRSDSKIISEDEIFAGSDLGPFIDFYMDAKGEILVTTPSKILKIVTN